MSKYHIPAGFEDDEEADMLEDSLDNLKISVIPDIGIGAAINGEDFCSDLEPELENWLDDFRDMWNAYKRSPAVQQKLKLLLMRDAKPLLLALKLFANSPGCNNMKNKNLALFILETICDLYKQYPDVAVTCDANTRLVAFNFIKTCGVVSLYKAVLDTYELHKIRDLLVPKVQELIAKGHYKDAAHWTMNLQIMQLFGFSDIVFPLILQDKLYLAEEFLNVAKEQQLPTVQFLDSTLDKTKSVYDHCGDILAQYKYVDVKHDLLSYRPMSKIVTRLAKRYKIDAQHTPNLNFTKTGSYLHYLYRKYRDGGMSADAWRELAHDAASSAALQLYLVGKIASYNDVPEAVYWVKHFGIPAADCPSVVQQKLQKTAATNKPQNSSSVNRSTTSASGSHDVTDGGMAASSHVGEAASNAFLTFQLPDSCIILVDDKPKFLDMLMYLETCMLIGFDSEWKPSVCNDNVVSLLQLSSFDRVYLVDCLAPKLTVDLWRTLGRQIFNNLEILKIGFSLHQDLRMLHKSLPLHLNLKATAYLDLRDLWRRLKYMQRVDFPYGQATHPGESLAVLTELCLGKKLDKSNQCSNWANRPLRQDQILYAALDAHCLLQIYEVLSVLLLRLGFDMDQVAEAVMTTKTGCLIRMKRSTLPGGKSGTRSGDATSQPITPCDNDTIRATDISFICDSMLYGLSKELRKLGIDCVDISTKFDVGYYIELAKREQRRVLTRDTRHAVFANKLPAWQCIYIPTDSSVDQVRNVIQNFHITVDRRNLFTRCVQCNSNEFILALRDEFQLMRFGQQQQQQQPNGDERRRSGGSTESCTKVSLYERTFNLMTVNEHIIRTKTTSRGNAIKLNRIKPHIIRSKEHFFICDNCGVCTWDGAHSLHNSIMELVGRGDTDTMAVSPAAAPPQASGGANVALHN